MDVNMIYPETVHTDDYKSPTRSASMTRVSSGIPIDLSAATPKHLFRVVSRPVNPGDLFFVKGEAKVMNDTGLVPVTRVKPSGSTRFGVGVGWRIAVYHYEDPRGMDARTYLQKSRGQNVTPDVHHMVLTIETYGIVPPEFPPGDRLVFQLLADAHSTAWDINKNVSGIPQPETLIVEDSGVIILNHYRRPVVPVASEFEANWLHHEELISE
jgi:hypothetical protein